MKNKILICILAFLYITGFSQVTIAAEEVSSIARGGKLYDKWFKVTGAKKPENTHPAWPPSNTRKKGNATHRCKACHGWDLLGKDGAYATGSYKTGIKGLANLQGASNSTIIASIKDSTHGFSGLMKDQDFTDLANFISKGQIDMNPVIDRKTKMSKGNKAQGEIYYNTVCANCHGSNGKKPKDMPALGKVSNDNPWEVLHKIQNGQPDEQMPALRAFDLQVSADILTYLQTLPKK